MKKNNIEKDLKEHSIEYVLDKYDLSFKELFDRQYLKYNTHQDAEYVYKTKDNRYGVQKAFGENTVNYGVYNDKETALNVVRKLLESDWDKKELPRILMELKVWGK